MAIALGTVFVLNSVALLIFPAIGGALKLSQSQFGLVGRRWQFMTPVSVVGAAAKYGAVALAIATTVKTGRAPCGLFALGGDGYGAPRQGEDSVALVHRFVSASRPCATRIFRPERTNILLP